MKDLYIAGYTEDPKKITEVVKNLLEQVIVEQSMLPTVFKTSLHRSMERKVYEVYISWDAE